MEADAGTRQLNLMDSAPSIHSEAGETMILNRLAPLAIPLSVHARTDQHPQLGHRRSKSNGVLSQHPAQSSVMGAFASPAHPELLADQLTAHTAAAGRDALSDGSA